MIRSRCRRRRRLPTTTVLPSIARATPSCRRSRKRRSTSTWTYVAPPSQKASRVDRARRTAQRYRQHRGARRCTRRPRPRSAGRSRRRRCREPRPPGRRWRRRRSCRRRPRPSCRWDCRCRRRRRSEPICTLPPIADGRRRCRRVVRRGVRCRTATWAYVAPPSVVRKRRTQAARNAECSRSRQRPRRSTSRRRRSPTAAIERQRGARRRALREATYVAPPSLVLEGPSPSRSVSSSGYPENARRRRSPSRRRSRSNSSVGGRAAVRPPRCPLPMQADRLAKAQRQHSRMALRI